MSKKPHSDEQDTADVESNDNMDAAQEEIPETDVEENAESAQAYDSGDLSMEQALEKLAAAELRADQAKDDLLRVQAEMQNLRRRTQQDVEKAHKFGQEKFSTELLNGIDNLERALASAADSEDDTVKAIYEGVDLTLKTFMDCFGKFNIEAVDPVGEPFDPALHQAMSMQENPDVEPNTVIAVMQKGYTLHGRVIRPAMVMVSKGAPGAKIDEQA